jgi:hypothetical protein
MAPVLRLYEDTLSNTAEAVGLPPVPRMIFVVHGAATIGGSAVSDGETWHGEADVMIAPGVSGVTGWRFELVPEGAGDAPLLAAGIRSQLKLAARLDTLRAGELLMRGDSVAFPPGGCAYLHRHQGPGEILEFKEIAEQPPCAVGDHDHVRLGQRLQARRQVRRVADDATFLRLSRSNEVTDHDEPSGDADAYLQRSAGSGLQHRHGLH